MGQAILNALASVTDRISEILAAHGLTFLDAAIWVLAGFVFLVLGAAVRNLLRASGFRRRVPGLMRVLPHSQASRVCQRQVEMSYSLPSRNVLF